MAFTDYRAAAAMQAAYPHTFRALQRLVMAMADYRRNRGKRTWLGRDKGLAAYKRFENSLRDSLLAMVVDGAIERDADARLYREHLLAMISAFAAAFPNWQDAYLFTHEYFVEQASSAEDRIAATLDLPPRQQEEESDAETPEHPDWPVPGLRRVWSPPDRVALLAIALPVGVKEVTRENYQDYLASRVQWMYVAANSPLDPLAEELADLGDNLLWLDPEGPVGADLVLSSVTFHTILANSEVPELLPAQPNQDPEVVEAILQTRLNDWVDLVREEMGGNIEPW